MMEKDPLCEEQTGEQPSQDAMILFGETPALSATVDSNEESPIEATISCRRGKVLLFLFFGSVETNHDEASKMPLIQKISNRVNGYHWNTQRGILGHSLTHAHERTLITCVFYVQINGNIFGQTLQVLQFKNKPWVLVFALRAYFCLIANSCNSNKV